MKTKSNVSFILQGVNMEKKEQTLRTVQPLSDVKYETIKALVLGTYKVKTVDRTREENNAITQFYRSRGIFHVKNDKLMCNNKEVMKVSLLSNIVKKTFNVKQGCGARPLSQSLRRKISDY